MLTILGDASSSQEAVTKRDPKRRHERRRGSAGVGRAILREVRIHPVLSGVYVDLLYTADVVRAIRLSTRSRFRDRRMQPRNVLINEISRYRSRVSSISNNKLQTIV